MHAWSAIPSASSPTNGKRPERPAPWRSAALAVLVLLSLVATGLPSVPASAPSVPSAPASHDADRPGQGPHGHPNPRACEPRYNGAVGRACDRGDYYELYDESGRPMGMTHKQPDPVPGSAQSSYPGQGHFHLEVPLACTTDSYHTRILYVRPSNMTSQYATLLPFIRQIAENANAKVDEAAMVQGVHANIKTECTGGTTGDPVVHNVTLNCYNPGCTDSVHDAHGIPFGNITSRLFHGDADEDVGGVPTRTYYNDTRIHYWVLYEGRFNRQNDTASLPLVCSGRGHIQNDDRPIVGNLNNGNGYVHFALTPHCGDQASPYLPGISPYTWLHEWGHNSGAVQRNVSTASPPSPPVVGSPNFTWGWHCTDGNDVMCYNDKSTQPGGPTGHNGADYATTACTSSSPYPYNETPFDCNQDDYFNRLNATQSCNPAVYLTCQWNLAHDNHRYLWFGDGPPDASFAVQPDPPCLGSQTTFVNTSKGGRYPLHEAFWNITDTTAGSSFISGWVPASTSYTFWYAQATILIVTLNVTDTVGNYTETSGSVPVEPCPQTWAAGDEINGELLVVGNDPGCGAGPPDSGVARPNDIIQSFPIGGAPITGHEPFPGGISLAGASSLSGLLFVAGGTMDCGFAPLASTQVYGGSWGGGPSLNMRRIAPAAATVGGTLYWAGGDKTGGDPLDEGSTHVPTPALESSTGGAWTREKNMPAGLIGSASLANGNELVVTGGYSHPQQTNRFIQIYDTSAGEWLGNHLPIERTDFGLGTCGDTQRIVVGGMLGEDVPMHAYYDSGATNSILQHTATGWTALSSLPRKTAFAQVADLGPWIFVQGGFSPPSAGSSITASSQVVRLNCPGGGVPSLPMAPQFFEAIADGEMKAAPCLPSTLTFLPLPISSPCLLLFIFGGTDLAEKKGSIYEPDCPSDHIYVMEPVDGNVIDLTETASTVGLSVRLLQPVASMGSVRLPDGRIMIVGGRTAGFDDDGQFSCYIPYNGVQIFDPLTLTVTPGPPLPKGLIAPAVTMVGNTVHVVGGDDRGDKPVPNTATDDRPRHPSASRYHMTGLGGWGTGGDLPLAVAHARLSFVNNRDAWLIGGTHHPLSSVRAVQENVAGEGNGAIPVLPWPLAHHNAESCVSSGGWSGWIITRGITEGTVYHTDPPTTAWAPSWLEYSLGLWSPAFGPPIAFAVGWGPTFTDVDTGTVPGTQRTLANAPMCPP